MGELDVEAVFNRLLPIVERRCGIEVTARRFAARWSF
jgi:hypothetical protein